MSTVSRLVAQVDLQGADSAARGADRVGSAVDGMGHRVAGAGRLLGIGALAVGSFALATGGIAVKAATGLQDSLVPIGTLLDTHSKAYANLSKQLTTFEANSPQSANDIGMAAYTTLSAGITGTSNVMATLHASQQLAEAGLGDLGQSTDLVTSAINSFKGENLSADSAARTFFGTIAAGKTTTAGLAQGFGEIAPLAASAGVSFHDLLAATAALTATGEPASVAYAGLRGAITNILQPSADAANAAKKLGIDFSQAHLKNVGFARFLDEIKDKTHGNVQTMSDLFGGVEGLNSVLALTGPQAGAFAANLTGIDKAGKNLKGRADEVADTWSNRFATMKNRVTTYLGQVGVKILDVTGPIAAQAKVGLSALVSAFNGEGVTSDGFVGVMEHIGVAARSVVDWIRANWPQISATIADVAGRVGAALATLAGYVQTTVAFVRQHWPEISKTISEVVAKVRPIVLGIVGMFRSAFGAAQAIIGTAVKIIQDLWARFGQHLVAHIKVALDTVLQILRGAIQVITGIFDFVKAVLTGKWGKAWDAIVKIFAGVWNIIVGSLRGVINEISTIIGAGMAVVSAIWGLAWHAAVTLFHTVFDPIVGVVSGIMSALWGAVGSIWESTGHPVFHAVGVVIGVLRGAFDSAKNAMVAAWEWIWDHIKPIIDKISGAISTISGALSHLNPFGGQHSFADALKGSGYKIDKNGNVVKAAHGALITGPTLALIGENPSTAPEVVSPVSTIEQAVLTGITRAPQLRAPEQDNADVVAELRAVRAELVQLRAASRPSYAIHGAGTEDVMRKLEARERRHARLTRGAG